MSNDGPAEERRKQIALTDEQRENVRKMLARFGGQMEPDKKRKADEISKETEDKDEEEEKEDNEVEAKVQDDLFLGVVPGTTVEFKDLTTGSKKYSFIREICCQFQPYVISKVEITPTEFKKACVMLGIEANNNSETLIACAVEQADPITLLHIQVQQLNNGNMIIQSIRFIT